MSLSAILFVNQKGNRLLERFYREDVRYTSFAGTSLLKIFSRSAADAFRTTVIARKEQGHLPIKQIDNATFMYVRFQDLYIIGVTRSNANVVLVFQFLYQLIRIFQSYFGTSFTENSLKNNFTLVYELLDEVADFGYPQLSEISLLQQFINLGKIVPQEKEFSDVLTGVVSWRSEGKHKYRKNEVYIDVIEDVNLLMANGSVLRADVTGKIIMKTYLSGMPECIFGLNDKLVMEQERKGAGIHIDDISFHKCVRLGRFDTDRAITFTPPDGEFELMKYRIVNTVELPFTILPAITLHGRTRVEMEIKIRANFSPKLMASNVEIVIPAPQNTAKFKMTVAVGSVEYLPEQKSFVWSIKKFPGNNSYILKGEVFCSASLSKKIIARPPLLLRFSVAMFTSSGIHVRYLRVVEKSGYNTVKWVRYITRSGKYEVRM